MRVSSTPQLWPFGAAVDEQERVASDSHQSLPTSSTFAAMPHSEARGSLSTVRSQHGSGYAAFDGGARMWDVAGPSLIMGRSALHNRAQLLRAAALVLVSAALCALAYSCLADDATSSSISGRGSRVSQVDEMQQRQMLDFDDDRSGDDGDGGSFGDSDGNSDGSEFGDSFSDADDLENSGSFVGYLAWSDAKLQHVLNSTHMQLWQMVHQWNRTYSPAHVGEMKHKVWLLQNAFSRHGYLLDDAEHGLENLHQLTKKAMREVQGATAALNLKVNAELRHIVNHTRALVARGARADLEQGRKLIKAEQIDLNTEASVRRKVKEAQQLLVALKSRVHNVTSTMLASALAWSDFAAADMRGPTVCICVNILICMFVFTYIHIYLCTYTCKFMFINVCLLLICASHRYVYVCLYANLCLYVCTHTHTHTHTNTHAHTQTRTHILRMLRTHTLSLSFHLSCTLCRNSHTPTTHTHTHTLSLSHTHTYTHTHTHTHTHNMLISLHGLLRT